MSSEKGDRWEREYRNQFREMPGFVAVRMPSSGSGTTQDLPDLHIWYNDGLSVWQFAAEVKATRDNTSLSDGEIEALCNYASTVGAMPIVMAHVDYTGDYVFPIEDLHETPEGNYSIRKGRDIEEGTPVGFEDFFGSMPS